MADAAHANSAAPAHGDGHAHPPYLAHHFDTPLQQFDSGKLGMWLFLATEILLFGGLFCAYSVYRRNHPEIFEAGHVHLDKNMGALNTLVLIASSFTMATGVYCAQKSKRVALIVCLILTLLGGATFMVVKYFEYRAKWQHGLLWGANYKPHLEEHHDAAPVTGGAAPGHSAPAPSTSAPAASAPAAHGAPAGEAHALATPGSASAPAAAVNPLDERSTVLPAAVPPGGLAPPRSEHEKIAAEAKNVQIFFGIYFAMTGLHGLHVLVGMAVIAWLLVGAWQGRFSGEYYTPVDLGGLYWHLVDLIWIYLFPLLYLIH